MTEVSTSELWRLSAEEVAIGVKSRAFSAREVTASAIKRMEAVNPRINAVVAHDPERSFEAADRIDAMVAVGKDPGCLAGVPVTIKAGIDQVGYPTTMGVTSHKEHYPSANGTVVDNFERAGAIPIGRSNMPSYGLRWFTGNLLHGETFNPFDRSLTPGGSSGGASAALAVGIGAIAHGTDIGGSIRYPAYACGVHGLRPSFGRVANYNPSLPERSIGGHLMTVSGPLARTVGDLRLALEAMAQEDVRDPWWVPAPLLGRPLPKRVALCVAPDGLQTEQPVIDALFDAADRLRDAGWTVEQVTQTPPLRDAAKMQVKLWLGDDYEAMVRTAEVEGDPGALTMLKGQREAVRDLTLAGFAELFKVRTDYLRRWQLFFERYPVLMLPVSARLPFPSNLDMGSESDYLSVWEAQIPQLGLPFMGLPGLAVATGMHGQSPVGIQLTAARFREDVLLDAAEDIANRGTSLSPIDPV